jgi:hypothetical protein
LTSRSALEGERKQVTVLFADVKGSMNVAEQVDPEVDQIIVATVYYKYRPERRESPCAQEVKNNGCSCPCRVDHVVNEPQR